MKEQEISSKKNVVNSAEKKIEQLINSGKISEVGIKAIAQSHKLGLSVTIVENGKIIRLQPNGNKKQIGVTSIRKINKKYSGKMPLQ